MYLYLRYISKVYSPTLEATLPGSDWAIVEEALDVVDEDAGQGGAVGVVKDAADLHALGTLSEAHHVLGAADLDEGKAGVLGLKAIE